MNHNRVCFCWANRRSPLGISVGVSLLSRELTEAGFNVQIVHWHERVTKLSSPEDVAEQIASLQPDILLVSFGTNQARDVKEMLMHLKTLAHTLPVCVGGVHPTLRAEEVLQWGTVDYVFVGEADGRIAHVVSHIVTGEDLSREPNIALQLHGRAVVNSQGPVPDIANQTLPYWDGTDYAGIISQSRGFVNVISGRGCPFRCAYCHNSSQPFGLRKRSVENVIEELRQYKERYGDHVRVFNFGDDMFVADIDWLEGFAERYRRVIGNVPFAVNATVNYVTARTAKALASAGCYTVRIGLESGSQRLRNLLRRPDSLEMVRGAVALLHEEHINVRAYIMVGIPTETRDELFSSFALAGNLGTDSVRPSIFFPYPGTPAHRFCVENRLLAGTWDVGNYFTETILTWSDPSVAALMNNVMLVQGILLNATYLKGQVPELEELQHEVYEADSADWNGGLARVLQIRCFRILERLRKDHIPHYTTPISHRPELCFLVKERERPIPGIDWSARMSLTHLDGAASLLAGLQCE